MPANPRSKELEKEIWEAIGEILSDRSYGEPLVDTTFWTETDYRAYRTAMQKVKLSIEKKAGHGPDPSDPGYKDWAERNRR